MKFDSTKINVLKHALKGYLWLSPLGNEATQKRAALGLRPPSQFTERIKIKRLST